MDKQIIVNIKGGLGNQLFCYASARYLSIKHKRKLVLDKRSGFVNDTYLRKFKLRQLNLPKDITFLEQKSFTLSNFSKRISKFIPLRFRYYLRDKYLSAQKLSLAQRLKSNVYMDGYWQSENYFPDMETLLQEEFRFSGNLPDSAKNILFQIQNTNSVMVHIRRKNYAHLLQAEYYKKSIETIKQKIENSVFFVFSDDFDWIKTNNIFDEHQYLLVDALQPDEELVDFELMKSCQHAIVANSSFSWWAAWLIENEHKLIICPSKTGFALEMPNKWTKISVEL